jgi:hypothetical protein
MALTSSEGSRVHANACESVFDFSCWLVASSIGKNGGHSQKVGRRLILFDFTGRGELVANLKKRTRRQTGCIAVELAPWSGNPSRARKICRSGVDRGKSDFR